MFNLLSCLLPRPDMASYLDLTWLYFDWSDLHPPRNWRTYTLFGRAWYLFEHGSFIERFGLSGPGLGPVSTWLRTGHGSCFCIVAIWSDLPWFLLGIDPSFAWFGPGQGPACPGLCLNPVSPGLAAALVCFLSGADLTILGLVWLVSDWLLLGSDFWMCQTAAWSGMAPAIASLGSVLIWMARLLFGLGFTFLFALCLTTVVFGLTFLCRVFLLVDCCQSLFPAIITHQSDLVCLLYSSGFNLLQYVPSPCMVWSCACLGLGLTDNLETWIFFFLIIFPQLIVYVWHFIYQHCHLPIWGNG